ncbi:glycosyltransferase family 4 protein [Terrimonas ferruginea]|uniref:glycosyltransferase family 4 protein n=1 Tax=Terrimonas ferruginea TaxID=249 RepID=UPI0003F7575A|nr:glycosyltransferase family 4 protein [Terrimonas ferruginea]
MFEGKHVLIVVENLPSPFDRRVWQEATTLRENGAAVSIICPKMKGYTKSYEHIDGIDIYRHSLPLEARGAWGYLREYTAALWWEFILAWKIYFKRRFHVIQGCNPPDLIFLVALFFKPFGVKYVFDHHDINPELYIAKYNKKGFFYKFLLLVEKLTFKSASYSIATNESYRQIAIERGGMKPEKVTVVRSGPKLDRLRLTEGNAAFRKGRTFLIGYVGVIGEQEGLDLLLESAAKIVAQRQDVQFAIVGGGTDLEKIKQLSTQMGLDDYVDFYGRVDDQTLVDVLNTADVCVNPDKPTEMNNLSTMNKIMEYMALKKPIVQFDLKEGRVSAREASLYAENNDTADFADKICWLLDNPEERTRMGEYGYQRILNELSWNHEKTNLLNVYRKVFRLGQTDAQLVNAPTPTR